MTKNLGFIAVLALSISLLASALIVRSGLVSIATQIQEKPIPNIPERFHLTAGDANVNVDVGRITVQPPQKVGEVNISIDNLKVNASSSQPVR
jgi:hypothetical protein